MLIRFIPAASNQSTIIFSLSFLDNGRPCPLSLVSQFQQVVEDNLELPHDWHALDKSVGLICLIDEVVFLAKERQISCRFKDGCIEEWPMTPSCAEMLDLVLSDVNEATLAEREIKQRPLNLHTARECLPLSLNSLKNKHKKQRSILMSFVSSIVPGSSNNTPPRSLAPHPSSPPPPVIQVSPRTLRRRARSNLVNAFRTYALPELKMCMPNSGYYPWVIQSMLRRTSLRLQELTRGSIPYVVPPQGWNKRSSISMPSLTYEHESGEFSDDDADSLRTPSIQHTAPSAIQIQNDSEDAFSECKRLESHALAEYAAFSDLACHLEHLLHLNQKQEQARERREREADSLLAVRSRRRAWLNKALVGGAWEWGLASSFQSSPLAQYSRTPEEFHFSVIPIPYLKVLPTEIDQSNSRTTYSEISQLGSTEPVESREFDLSNSGDILNRTLRQSLSEQSAQDLQDSTWTFRAR